MKIIVDADACPKKVLQICFRVAKEYELDVWTIASINHHIESDHHITVDSGSQEADLKVINVTEKGDIVITQDWGLASIVLSKSAVCLSPSGREYSPEKIDFMMEERELKARHRRAGGRTKGPKKRKTEDDKLFEHSLRRVINIAAAGHEAGK
ncbi:YaiI/YqxD family protein [Desulfuribacillus alkaliarsenatis]|uniref:UPF0178 protein BHF68_04240 n=1 Tax=Desulfuribacillus alkaliarsenatis TaxID=766136 RepID=A0A1E5G2W3_9FIRM|nr:YaiI/YqxD family protein [Desulfuribacillus alkaliarsenatis]OEF97425.1 hypothetical protein BHF68_04240 [Desulfuribacillus alkaliarsenatis]